MIMKIAVPTRGERVDDHFGHCESYTIYNIGEDNSIAGKEIIAAPQGCGCKSNIVGTLHEMGVSVMLAGNMGEGAFNLISNYGIEVIRGCSGITDQVVDSFLSGGVADNHKLCSHHGSDHKHTHGHDHGHGHVCNH
jgi:predicted Fe-Mo cluster-binding NifX family protein